MQETVKAAAKATGIPTDCMLIAATHTHSGGSLVSALGTQADPAYCEFLPGKLVECITQAAGNLQPARIGWSSEDYAEGAHCRVFIRRPDCLDFDPLGRQNVRAMMHPSHQNPEFIGPCGPSDPQVSVLAVQTPEGEPIALLANYSMHYFGAEPISADYYGDFVRNVSQRLAADDTSFIAMMSHGTSGDQVAVHVNGDARPIFSGKVSVTRPAHSQDVFVGGRSDNFANFEGRLAEVAIFAG